MFPVAIMADPFLSQDGMRSPQPSSLWRRAWSMPCGPLNDQSQVVGRPDELSYRLIGKERAGGQVGYFRSDRPPRAVAKCVSPSPKAGTLPAFTSFDGPLRRRRRPRAYVLNLLICRSGDCPEIPLTRQIVRSIDSSSIDRSSGSHYFARLRM